MLQPFRLHMHRNLGTALQSSMRTSLVYSQREKKHTQVEMLIFCCLEATRSSSQNKQRCCIEPSNLFREASLLPTLHTKCLSPISNLLLITQLLYYISVATKRGIFKPFCSLELLARWGRHWLHVVILH